MLIVTKPRSDSTMVQRLPRAEGAAPASGAVSGAQCIQRAACLLHTVSDHHAEGIRLVDLADQAGLERPTAHRILKSLTAEGLVAQDPLSRRYHLGQTIVSFALAIARNFDFQSSARPILEALAARTGDTYYLNQRVGNEALCLIRTDGICPVKNYSIREGERRPLGVGAGGLAMLGALPLEQQERIIAINERALTQHKGMTRRALDHMLSRSRALGYALLDIKGIAGVQAVGVPIFSRQGAPVAAISVASIPGRLETRRVDELLGLLRPAARTLEELAGDGHW